MSRGVTRIFLRARELDGPERASYLAGACAGDEALRREVESLLEHDATAARLMPDDAPGRALDGAAPDVTRFLADLGPSAPRGSIGKYPILGEIGRGGMGLVYRAEQEYPRRPIALKVLRPEFLSPSARKRLAFEAEILGRLAHPGIARVYEAGTFESEHGPQPWFAMELIEGRPLLEHCRERALGLEAKLRLVIRIAEAVQYAHAQGVVHRDLKPANVLVDAQGAPKVLDFGIARVSDADLAATTQLTGAGELVGTLPYMSPEQLGGDPAAVDARADVYALGVTLYELCAGRLPLELENRPLTEALRLVQEVEPPRLGNIDPALAGDLERIVHKALAKERERRYATAAELALDLGRFLDHQPILARAPSTLYVLRKFARRHRALTAASAVAAGLLMLGLIATLLLYQREKRQAARNLSLTTFQRLQELREDAGELWPQGPNRREHTLAWLARAEALVEELPVLERHLDEARRAGRVEAGGLLRFERDAERWLHDSLGKVVREVQALAAVDAQESLLAEVRQRLALADRIVAEQVGEHAPEWDACLAAFGAHPAYADYVLEPQAGLVPLRADPASGLWEFWHPASGTRPELDVATDLWRITGETGIVFVLLPAGNFTMGAQAADPALPLYDVNRRPDTGPIHPISISSPFFLSRFELTRGQWRRLGGALVRDDEGHTDEHPLSNVSFDECSAAFGLHSLGFPSEAQWEYAARAGTTTFWFGGADERAFPRFLNGRDQSYESITPHESNGGIPWDDSFAHAAPVGAFLPNPFGLHDVLGNVSEWCWDRYGSYELPTNGDDAERMVPATSPYLGHRVVRGGSYRDNGADTTCSARQHRASDERSPTVGVRPFRMAWRMPMSR